jgi:CubicO group peptidase (beta-lactamase class C family)
MNHIRRCLRYRFYVTTGLVLFNLTMISPLRGQDKFDRLRRMLQSRQQALGGNVCVLIFKDKSLVFEWNMGRYTQDTPEMIASCSKWLTAALVATFIDEGKIAAEDSIGKYLPVFSRHGKGNITISQCMSHTSGIENGRITLRGLLDRRKIGSLAKEVTGFATRPMSDKPGSVFSYGNIGLNTVGRILEVVTNKNFETLFQERIAKPLGMNKTTFAKGNVVNPSGGAVSTASDYMRFLQMILQKGEFKGKQIISQKSVALMQLSRTVNTKVVYSPEEAKGFEYGWGEWILEKDRADNSSVVSSPGLFGTYPWIDLQRNYAAIVFVKNLRFKDRQKNYLEIREYVNEAVD